MSGCGTSVCIVGGAGFIGSHFTDALMDSPATQRVTLFDNFSSGREQHYERHMYDARLRVARGDASDLRALCDAVAGHDVVIHLASNPDIARAATEPEIDFYQGTLLTNNVLEAMRRTGVRRLLYASGSGVYGERGETMLREDSGPLTPISTYGASKLAGEAMIASYCAMFGFTACVFRFANVVGARQTHGVGFDFLLRLGNDPARLRILGDGRQSKSYVHVTDVVAAALLASAQVSDGFHVWNVATDDAVTVTEIAEMAAEALGIHPLPVWEYTGGDRGWKGDVPVVRLDAGRMGALGWRARFNSREAVRRSLHEMAQEMVQETAYAPAPA
ncbi:MAG TPA: NAD-dependent epimerase/dehydratase family protein [Acidobacteriaceae bacterium]|nr:NAD-dependent epimerase/dehydratase family protein [Acidobacteriaceae bacterium]